MKNFWGTLRERGFRSVFYKNLLTIFSALFIPLLLFSVILLVSWNRHQAETLSSLADSELIRISSKMDTLLNEQSGQVLTLSYDENVAGFGSFADQPLSDRKILMLNNLRARLANISSGSILRSVVILYRGTQYYIVTQQTALAFFDPDSLAPAYRSAYAGYITLAQDADEKTSISTDGESIVFYTRSVQNGSEIISFIDVSKSTLSRFFQSETAENGAKVFLQDGSGGFLAGTDSRMPTFSGKSARRLSRGLPIYRDGENSYISVTRPSALSDWVYTLLLPCEAQLRTQNETIGLLCFVLLVVLIAIVFTAWFLSMSLYRPIQIITQLLRDPSQGTMDYYRDFCQKYDDTNLILTLIESSYFRHLATSKELEKRNRMLQSAQNYALAVQMNPHFIFNTLDSINWKVISLQGGDNDISSALGDFSRIMRYALNKKGLVQLSDEIDNARIYVRLRNTLSSARISVQWEIDEGLLRKMVPFLILQPLLENAITHGLRGRKEQGVIRIRCYPAEDALILEVEDNGVGFSPEKLAEIEALMRQDCFSDDSVHLGLLNTHNRIRLTYGEDWGLRIFSEPGKTVVRIRLPLAFHPQSGDLLT